jgi:hypothetical protein
VCVTVDVLVPEELQEGVAQGGEERHLREQGAPTVIAMVMVMVMVMVIVWVMVVVRM